MKILLVFPPATIYGKDPTVPGATPPLGVAYVAAYLEKFNYEVKILDALALGIDNIVSCGGKSHVGLSEEEISRYVRKYNPDVLGISMMYTAYNRDGHDIAGIAKMINPGMFVVAGGAHASINPELVLRDKNIDAVVAGEGEETFLELVKAIESGNDLNSVNGIVFKKDGLIKINPKRPYIQDIDNVPFPARHLLPMDIYFKKASGVYSMSFPHTQMATSRGCLGNCGFCSIHSIWGFTWRGRSAKNVVDEIEFLQKEYRIKELSFLDDNMANDRNRLVSICDEVLRRKIKISWTTPNGIAHWKLDDELIRKMKKSGCYRITFGIESGNLNTRRIICKPHSLEQAKSIIRNANRIGMWTICTFILGFPFEDMSSIEDTIKYAIDCDADFALFYLLTPFPGTRIYDLYKKEGLLDLDYVLDPNEEIPESKMALLGEVLAQRGCKTKFFNPEDLRQIQNHAYSLFWNKRIKDFLNPLRILRKIRTTRDLFYSSRLSFMGIRLRIRQLLNRQFSVQMLYRDYKKCQTK